jgi:hypothetical protein
MPPSTHRRSPIVTGGHTSGTAQLAATASTSGTPSSAPNVRNSPVCASTAVTSSRRAGHSCDGSRAAMTARRSASGTVGASSASRPRCARPASGCLRCRTIAEA